MKKKEIIEFIIDRYDELISSEISEDEFIKEVSDLAYDQLINH
jgi:hypothetical protein